ncbi:MAG: amidohydrolase family protein [Thermoanaerobaculia bacterium]
MRRHLSLCALLLASSLSASPIIIRATRVIDGRGHVYPHAAIVVDGPSIVRIEKNASSLKNVDYDLGNVTLMPGGIDTHVHIGWHFDADGRSHDDETDRSETPQDSVLFAEENAYKTLMGGITTVQSLGAPVDRPLRDAIARGVIPGPRILTAIDPIFDEKLTVDQMKEAVRKLRSENADVVKVFASQSIRNGGAPTMSQEQMNAICGEAKTLGMRVAVHAHGPESVRRAVLAGCTSVEHGALIDQPTLDLMAEHGTYFDPNIDLVFRNYFENKTHFLGLGNYTEEGFAQMEKAVPKALHVFQLGLKTPRLKMVFGTDAVAGSHGRNFQELMYRVRTGGQSPMDAITSATSLAAESLGLGDRVGSIAPGYAADIIAVKGNPIADIGALTNVIFVMRNGVVYRMR